MRFLLSRRWLLFLAAVCAMAWLATLLGQWQFHRLHQKHATNRAVAGNLAAPPVPIDDLLAVGREPGSAAVWRRVTVTGTWDAAHSVVVKYQVRSSSPGVDVATPLVTASGPAVIVDRGWLAAPNTGGTRLRLPPVTSGMVTVTGWVRANGSGASTQVDGSLQTRALSSTAISRVVPHPLYGGFLDLALQSPPADRPLGATQLPDDTGDGPHFFYGLQWWFFAALAVLGFCYLAYDEWRRAADSHSSKRTKHPAVDRHHRPGHE
ncbi:MAG: SURF1 family protein [Actinomycetota bacterium]|nr:SURF1 family protein [Actinomycetota bacterium]